MIQELPRESDAKKYGDCCFSLSSLHELGSSVYSRASSFPLRSWKFTLNSRFRIALVAFGMAFFFASFIFMYYIFHHDYI